MHIVPTDRVRPPCGERTNPLSKLLRLVEGVTLAAEREHYLADSLEYLFPFEHLEMGAPWNGEPLHPGHQDDKGDFQKQNVLDFHSADAFVVRGWVHCGEWTGPFLRLSYRGGPDSRLWQSRPGGLGDAIRLWLKVGEANTARPLVVPYNRLSGRYEVELWGCSPAVLDHLDQKGAAALARGELQRRPDLVRGNRTDFLPQHTADHHPLAEIAPDHTLHPVLPLAIELAWASEDERIWDSQNGRNYRYQFRMPLRGSDHYRQTGTSRTPHGGLGLLEYRNLFSNYGCHSGSGELGRRVAPWSFDAFGRKHPEGTTENFLAVDYLDLSVLYPGGGIGLHRHRDNQEIFVMSQGQGLMITGDWCQHSDRERCFEIRLLKAGHLVLLKAGQLHGLLNTIKESIALFTLGGYD
ncbi:MAG: hypothetical protein KME03_18120 [Aphanocapsa lilacina HA4352-LM1]|jgi:mannose-6-phosphate isomerase-like protein (cupin superfamily)|nr:hypothetical protein [Aphanocapsa lilacina HA4352-LM1]